MCDRFPKNKKWFLVFGLETGNIALVALRFARSPGSAKKKKLTMLTRLHDFCWGRAEFGLEVANLNPYGV